MPEHVSDAVVITGLGPICRQAVSVAGLRQVGTGAPGEELPGSGEWFQPERFLGTKGYKYLTQPTRYVLAATSEALKDAGLEEAAYAPEERGIFCGTNFGVHATLAAMDEVVLHEGAEALQPMFAPNFSVNLPASHISIKHRFLAFNISLTGAMVSGLEAVLLGAGALRSGRARLVVAAATEDTPPEGTAEQLGVPAVEGAACAITLESLEAARARGARCHARVGEGLLHFVHPLDPEPGKTLAPVLARALRRMLPGGQEPIPYCPLGAPFALNRAVELAVRRALTELNRELLPVPAVGASGAFLTASPLLQLATLAAVHGQGLALATSPQGHIALMCLEKVPAP